MKCPNSKIVPILTILTVLEGFAALVYQITLPSGGTFLFGYSFLRILLFLLLIFFSGFEIYFFLKIFTSRYFWESSILFIQNRIFSNRLGLFLFWVFEIFLILIIFTPGYRFESLKYYFIRLRPILILLLSFTLKVLLLYYSQQIEYRKYKLKWILITFVIFSVILFSFFLGIGWKSDGYWKQPGIPLLISDLLLIFLLYIFSLLFLSGQKLNNKIEVIQKFDFFAILVIWILAVIIWFSIPFHENPFISSPTPPEYDYFPLSDAQFYDLDALNMIYGGTLGVSGYADKPLYSFFLYLLHMSLPNGTYRNLSDLQLAFFSGTPALFYILGGIINKRKTGILLSLFGIAYGKSLLQSSWIILSGNPRLFSTAFPSIIMLCILLIITIRWSQNKKKTYLLFLLGGLSGLATLLRYNFWILLPAFILFIVLVNKNKLRVWSPIIFLLAFMISIAPWQIRSEKVIGTSTYFVARFVNVVWKGRFSNQEIELVNPKENIKFYKSEILFEWLPLINVETYTLNLYNQDGSIQGEIKVEDAVHCSTIICQYSVFLEEGIYFWEIESENFAGVKFFSSREKFEIYGENSSIIDIVNNDCKRNALAFSLLPMVNINCNQENPFFSRAFNLIGSLLNNTMHNLLAPLFTFPTTIINHDHSHLMYKNDSVWWESIENIRFSQWLMLLINIAICVQGYRSLYKNNRLIATIPLGVYVFYCIGLAVARTSGGRYIIPLTTIPLLYWSIGLGDILEKFVPYKDSSNKKSPIIPINSKTKSKSFFQSTKYLAVVLMVIVPAFSLVAFETYPTKLIPQKQQDIMYEEISQLIMTEVDQNPLYESIRNQMIADPNILKYGYAFYPIWLDGNNPKNWSQSIYQNKEYSRLTFTILNDKGKIYSEFRTENAIDIHHGALIAYISCPKQKHQDILAVFIFDDNGLKKMVSKENSSRRLSCDLE